LITDDETRVSQFGALRSPAGQTRGQSELDEKTTQKVDRSFRCRIKFDFLDIRERAAVCDYYTVNRSVGRNRNVVNYSINWVAQKFETGNERDVERAFRQSLTQGGWMVELNIA
jgi:hypothetical protein